LQQFCIYSEEITSFGLHSFLVASQKSINSKLNEAENNKHPGMKASIWWLFHAVLECRNAKLTSDALIIY